MSGTAQEKGELMPGKKHVDRDDPAGKILWVSYRLQSLSTKRFVVIANKILQGEQFLVELPSLTEMLEA
jgi:hypothetical protein